MLHDHLAYLTLAGLRPRSIRSRREVVTAFAAHIKPRSLRSANRRDVEGFLSRNLSASSRRTYLGHLRSFYRWAVEEELLQDDPTAKVRRVAVKPGTPRPLNTDQLALAIDNAPPRMRCWLLLMSLGGLRCLEVSALRPCDIIDADGTVLLYLRECKGGGTATVPAHPAILDALSALPIRDELWWRVTANTVSTEVSRYLHSVGLDATAHRLRHSFATQAYRVSGADLLTTSRLLRHASVATSQVYAAIDPARPAEVVRLIPLPTRRQVSS